MIYLDNSATTQPRPEVLESFMKVSSQFFGNPSSIHGLGMEAERLLRRAREQAADLLNVEPHEVVFTSGGTEGNNMAIKGIALEHQTRGRHIITSKVEHPSVLEACQSLERLGFEVSYLDVNGAGIIDINQLKANVREDTILVTIMHVNNEIGSIQPIKQIGAILREYPKVFFHVDYVQGFGKEPLSIKDAQIDLCTISGHKIHGLKGTGLLYVKNGIRLFALANGGGQERRLRSGTENLAGIVSLVKAMRLIQEAQKKGRDQLMERQEKLLRHLKENPAVVVNTPDQHRAPHIVNFSVPGLKPEVVIHALEEQGIMISTKSACSSKSADESAVLAACGKEPGISAAGLRVSMSYDTTTADIATFCEQLDAVITNLQQIMR
ncbi:cysteine desulfurase family protein [Gracilibacillus alcaliphilus]|uniref:cysteine desulfurase family protein n=1 Tax=Gracilibacillus alcaliphilus TaxID=1401441 RepID=UPI0019568F3D|nr:cysteine desulfurase family protein [Gracilibacillus alcaliphilus]MBM7676876.1 cysteine desulfurase [Gracilibacillus alcaliphilus]